MDAGSGLGCGDGVDLLLGHGGFGVGGQGGADGRGPGEDLEGVGGGGDVWGRGDALAGGQVAEGGGDGGGFEPGEDGANRTVEVEEQVPGRGDDVVQAPVGGAGHPAGS